MAVVLGLQAIKDVLRMSEVIDLLERMSAHEAAGATFASPRFVSDFRGGQMRILFAADHAAGYFATKAYHTVQGVGTRYVVSLYRLGDGALLALIDGRLVTDLRTGAASGVVARKLPLAGPVTLGVLGSGHQARSQLECLASVYDLAGVAVFSPTRANRETFAAEMGARLGVPITAVDSVEAAVRGRTVVAAATNARGAEPILRGEWLDGCRLLCAVGNTRPQFAEADVRCFADARLVVTDTRHAIEEAGDLRRAVAAGALQEQKRATLADIVAGTVAVPDDGLVAFKSVGSALQDLALAARYYELLGARPGLPQADDLASLG